jgi:NADPH-dependent curcumin reductase CurA
MLVVRADASGRGEEAGMSLVSREIRLAARPVGMPDESSFELVEVRVPDPGRGELLVRNVYMSVDPYMRGRMNDVKSYAAPFQIGEPLTGAAVGQVLRSNHPGFDEGEFVLSESGWRECFLSQGQNLRKIDAKLAPVSAYLGVLGMPGLSAYAGLLEIGKPKEGETVFVSGAAGAVGSLAGQIAKIRGCHAIGSTGSDSKVGFLRDELGFDGAFNYRTTPPRAALRELAPRGIDIYFDNVGGEQLEAAISAMRPFGRIPVCGMISMYNATEPPSGPKNLILVVGKRITIRGFLVGDHLDRYSDFVRDVSAWLREGRILGKETVVEGIESAPAAFLGMLGGENVGKMLVRLAPEPA